MPVKENPVLSHHFVPNTYREEKFDKLSVIQSMGEQEGVDTPLNPKSIGRNRNGSQTPLSKFVSLAPGNLRRVQQESMTPVATRSRNRGSIISDNEGISEFNKIENKGSARKSTLPMPGQLY